MPESIISEAAIPNPSLKPFEKIIGRWKTEGTHPLMPNVTLHGLTSVEWLENGAFVIMHSSIEEVKIPSGIVVFGSDNDAGSLHMLYFDERQVSRRYDVSFTGNELKWWRNTPAFSQNCTMRISADGNTITSKGEMSREGRPWEQDLTLTYQRLMT